MTPRVVEARPPCRTLLHRLRHPHGQKQRLSIELGSLERRGRSQVQFDDEGVLQGLVLGTLTPEHREQFDIPSRIEKGIVVIDVERGSPAARTGLRPGDVVLEANRKELNSIEECSNAYERADDRLLLLIYRDGSTLFLALPKVE